MNRNEGVCVNDGSNNQLQIQSAVPSDAHSSTRSRKEKYKDVLFRMGIAESIIGILCFVLGIATLGVAFSNRGYYETLWHDSPTFYRYYHTMTYPAQGIWGGAFASVVGILGIRASSNPSQCMYNANMALSIIGANVMGVLTILSGIAAGTTDYRVEALIAVHSVLTIIGFIAMILMIIHSAYCCAGVCCKHKSPEGFAVSYHPGPIGMQQPQLIQLANGQYVMAPAQTIVSPYPVAQVPIVGGPVAYQQPPQAYVTAQLPANQYFHVPGVQIRVAPAHSAMNAAAPQAVAPVAQQFTTSNAQAGKEEEANASPSGYTTLPSNE